MNARTIHATEPKAITLATDLLRPGAVKVALLTVIVYGLSANTLDVAAVAKIVVAKDRSTDHPLIMRVVGREML